MTAIEWNVNQIECIKSLEELTNVVVKIYYSATATSGTYTATHRSAIGLRRPGDPENFIEYENLSEDIVLSWVFNAIGGTEAKMAIETALTAKIEKELNEPTEITPLPWGDKNEDMDPVPPPEPNDTPSAPYILPVLDTEVLFPTLVFEEPVIDTAPTVATDPAIEEEILVEEADAASETTGSEEV
jgi:hypothetical protein